MTRTKVVIVVTLVVVLGFFLGWWLSGTVRPVSISPVQEGATTSAPPRVTDGYCCFAPGQSCERVITAAACLTTGGKGFNTRQKTCDHFCITIGSIKP